MKLKVRDLAKLYGGEVSIIHIFDEVWFGDIDRTFEHEEDKWILDSEVYLMETTDENYLKVWIRQ